ncbi:hypothetical protein [Clavibacter michiganensis]|uniref:hypothetical protein n=1 Tax=Clavibacter michiganensis TaxID=28447 RepID=UPI0005BA98E3|nr:hypothetical protein [Clavibacter michiganensis]
MDRIVTDYIAAAQALTDARAAQQAVYDDVAAGQQQGLGMRGAVVARAVAAALAVYRPLEERYDRMVIALQRTG